MSVVDKLFAPVPDHVYIRVVRDAESGQFISIRNVTRDHKLYRSAGWMKTLYILMLPRRTLCKVQHVYSRRRKARVRVFMEEFRLSRDDVIRILETVKSMRDLRSIALFIYGCHMHYKPITSHRVPGRGWVEVYPFHLIVVDYHDDIVYRVDSLSMKIAASQRDDDFETTKVSMTEETLKMIKERVDKPSELLLLLKLLT